MPDALLELRNVKKYFPVAKGLLLQKVVGHVKAVDDVSFTVYPGDVFGLVGESGCGKTTTSRMILRLESITDGSILFEDKDIAKYSRAELKHYRSSVQAMFQDPYSSLSPRMKIGDIISEPIWVNMSLTKAEIHDRVTQILGEVKLSPESANLYPHEFSGGQRQRIALARAVACQPQLVILDEPVSALDVSVRAQLMNLLMDIKDYRKFSYLVIAHDLAVVRHMCNRMVVMYLGKIVEYGRSESIFAQKLHPYTKALFSAALPYEPNTQDEEIILPGEVPSSINPPSGCRFHTRCLYCKDICRELEPPLEKVADDHFVACHFWKEIS
jgi:oligopeptide/dipeptide ABC transporter ATP-binding protein